MYKIIGFVVSWRRSRICTSRRQSSGFSVCYRRTSRSHISCCELC